MTWHSGKDDRRPACCFRQGAVRWQGAAEFYSHVPCASPRATHQPPEDPAGLKNHLSGARQTSTTTCKITDTSYTAGDLLSLLAPHPASIATGNNAVWGTANALSNRYTTPTLTRSCGAFLVVCLCRTVPSTHRLLQRSSHCCPSSVPIICSFTNLLSLCFLEIGGFWHQLIDTQNACCLTLLATKHCLISTLPIIQAVLTCRFAVLEETCGLDS